MSSRIRKGTGNGEEGVTKRLRRDRIKNNWLNKKKERERVRGKV